MVRGNVFDRVQRYICVWRWLLAYNIGLQPIAFGTTILFGICGRLGTLVGFALSVKCAAVILKPDLMPAMLAPYFPEDRQTLFLVLALMPGLAFGGGALAQIIHHSSILRLRNSMAEHLVLAITAKKLAKTSPEDLSHRSHVATLAAAMRTTHSDLVTIEVIMIKLIVTGSVLLLALIGGLLIDWRLMALVTSVGVTFALTTAVFRHMQSRDSNKHQRAVQASEKAKIKALAERVDAEAEPERNRDVILRGLHDLVGTMSNVKSVDQRFNNISALILDLGQAAIIMTFLILLIGSDEADMPMLIILVLIFRFFVSYLQTIAHAIIKLGPRYPDLVELWRTLTHDEVTTASSGAQHSLPHTAPEHR